MSDQPTMVPPPAAEPHFDAERLDCYRVALDFQLLASSLISGRGVAALRDQLDRASISIPLNIAEAMGRVSPLDRARFIAIARGSATECAAIVDLLRIRGLARGSACREARALLLRIVQMLTKLNARFAG